MRVFFDRPPLDEALRELGSELERAGPYDAEWPGSDGAAVGGAIRYDAARFAANPELRVVARTGIGIDLAAHGRARPAPHPGN